VELRDLDTLKVILEYNNELKNTIDSEGETVLMTTIRVNDFEMVKWLIEGYCRVNPKTTDVSPLIIVFETEVTFHIGYWLLSAKYAHGDDRVNDKGQTGLMMTVDRNRLTMAGNLLEFAGADIELVDNNGKQAWDFINRSYHNDYEDEKNQYIKFLKIMILKGSIGHRNHLRVHPFTTIINQGDTIRERLGAIYQKKRDDSFLSLGQKRKPRETLSRPLVTLPVLRNILEFAGPLTTNEKWDLYRKDS
jgi:hypothetical protein